MLLNHAIARTPKWISRERGWDLAVLLGSALVLCLLAARRGPDANWDLLNYHEYNPFALLHKPFGYDMVAAQLQTFLNPALDLPIYFLRVQLNNWPRLLNAVLALPQALAAFLAYRVALEMLPPPIRSREILALIAIVFGVTGVASLSTLGTSQSEMVPACFLLGGLLLVLRSVVLPRIPYARLAAAGLLCGIAFGLKMTLLPYCIGLGLAVGATCGALWRARLASAAAFVAGGAAGAVLTGGAWWLHLYLAYGSPLFPYFNNIFHSPFYVAAPLTDERFKPADLLHALFYPFFWMRRQNLIAEIPFRDPRMALAYVAVIAAAAAALAGRWSRGRPACGPDARGWCLLIFLVTGFALWEAQFSILRYLAPIELVCGAALLLALRPLLMRGTDGYRVHAALAGGTALVLAWTVYPQWGHAPKGPVSARVELPALAPDSLVILLDSSPMSFIAAHAPAAVRFVGANNNLVRPGLKARLQDDIETVIRTHRGPLWGLEEDAKAADAALAYYGLHRTADCAAVRTNLNNDATRICRLARDAV